MFSFLVCFDGHKFTLRNVYNFMFENANILFINSQKYDILIKGKVYDF